MELTEFNLDIAKQLVESKDNFPVDFEQAYIWLGYSRKDNAKRAFLNSGFIEGVDFNLLTTEEVRLEGERKVEREIETIKLTIDCFKMWAMLSKTEQGNKVRLYFLECEKIAKQAVSIPNEFMLLMQNMQEQLNSLTNRTHRLDTVEEENKQLEKELTDTKQVLQQKDIASQAHPGCNNIIERHVVCPNQRWLTPYEFLHRNNYDMGLLNTLVRRTASLYRTSKKQEPPRNYENNLIFEESYIAEVYQSLLQRGVQ